MSHPGFVEREKCFVALTAVAEWLRHLSAAHFRDPAAAAERVEASKAQLGEWFAQVSKLQQQDTQPDD